MIGAHTAAELHSAPGVVAALLDRLDAEADVLAGSVSGGVLFVGCGSSHLIGGIAAALLRRRAGVAAEAVVASEAAYDPAAARGSVRRTVVAVSRSGRTSETLAAVAATRRAGPVHVIALVCDGDSPLATAADTVVAMPEAAEKAIAQTRSTAAALAFAVLLAERAAGRDGRPGLRRAAAQLARCRDGLSAWAQALAVSVGEGRLVLLGSAERWWLAREAVLKVTEMARVAAVAERVLEVPHGPIEGIRPDDTVVVLPAPEGKLGRIEEGVVRRLRSLVDRVVVVGEDTFTAGTDSGEPLLAQLHGVHLLALALATARGIDADRPVRLTPHVSLDDA